MKHNFLDRYASLDSPLHTLEARTKLVGFLALIVAALWVPTGKSGIFFANFFVTAILIGISQIPLGFVLGRTLVIIPFVLTAALAAPWKGGLDPTWFSSILMRSLLCLIFLLILTNTTRFPELLGGLRKLGCPQVLVLNLGFLYRYLFVLTEEVLRMRQARDCRDVGRKPWTSELKILGSMLGTVLLRSFERAERMYQAMLSRGYSGEFPILSTRSFTWRDLCFLSSVGLFIGLIFHWGRVT